MAGFTLVEVLIALLLFSVGMLGLAGLQTSGMRFTQDAYLRSQATIVAQDIIDRMRANNQALADGNYDNIDSEAPPSDQACIVNGCNSLELANHDIRDWSLNLVSLLPQGQGTVVLNGNLYTVTMTWQALGLNGPEQKNLAINFQLQAGL